MKAGVIPYGIGFNKWANQMSILRPDLVLSIPSKVEDWVEWASDTCIQNAGIYPSLPIPSRKTYPEVEDWRKWAAQFVFLVT